MQRLHDAGLADGDLTDFEEELDILVRIYSEAISREPPEDEVERVRFLVRQAESRWHLEMVQEYIRCSDGIVNHEG